jgi:hypothetical protein
MTILNRSVSAANEHVSVDRSGGSSACAKAETIPCWLWLNCGQQASSALMSAAAARRRTPG